MELLKKLSNLISGLGKNEKPQMPEWFGSYLDEDGMVADVVRRVSDDQIALNRWLDPWSWKFPYTLKPGVLNPPEHAGCLIHAGRGIRNFYGLWHADNPHTGVGEYEVTDGIVTDPRHPDNFSQRVVERAKAELARLFPEFIVA